MEHSPPRERGTYRSPANRVFRRSSPARRNPTGCDVLFYCLNRSLRNMEPCD
jgi:hypothetical protein